MPLFFLGGAHGTGKSSLADSIGARLAATVLSASQLIREEGVEPSAPDKRVGDIDGNQQRLLRALARYRASNTVILLDGHYCLRSDVGEPVAVSLAVFRRMLPDALLLLVDEPTAIVQRLKERDGQSHKISDVVTLLECELANARLVSAELRIPLSIVRPPDAAVQALRFLEPKVT